MTARTHGPATSHRASTLVHGDVTRTIGTVDHVAPMRTGPRGWVRIVASGGTLCCHRSALVEMARVDAEQSADVGS